jgi:hypothetical protein
MNTLEQNINDIVVWIKTTATATQGFVTEQTPMYIKELLGWYFWDAIFGASIFGLFSVIFLTIGITLIKNGMKIVEENKSLRWKDPSGFVGGGIMTVIIGVGISTGFFVNMHDAIKVKVAPRVVLVEEISKKLK